MQASYSRISTFKKCPYQYKLHYIDELKIIQDPAADDALIIGECLHYGIETDKTAMLNKYFSYYHVIDDNQINESIKLEYLLDKMKQLLSGINIYAQEYLISTKEFKGIVDLITRNGDGSIDVFDFKYSNNIDHYLESAQLHIYKYFLEQKGFKVNKLGFIFIPKISIKQKKTEQLYEFRNRLKEELKKSEIKLIEVTYDKSKVDEFLNDIKKAEEAKEFSKNPTPLCDWCEYQKFCMEGIDYMILPKNKRREIKVNTTPDMWLYGDSYTGKTTFMDSFDDVLMLNTDGNVDNISSPVIRITDTIKVEGRLTTRIYAWQNFLDVVAELEKKDNDFKIIVIDLVEDLFEHCRLYMYNKLGIEHEQDAGYGKGWDMVRTEFLSNIKRLKNCGYQIVYISKVVVSEIIKKNGEKVTTIKPNINDKVANVLAGTVDLTARVVADGDERYLSFKTSPYIFGGSRYNFGVDQIELNKDIFIETLKNAQKNLKATDQVKDSNIKEPINLEPEMNEAEPKNTNTETSNIEQIPQDYKEQQEQTQKRTRRSRKVK